VDDQLEDGLDGVDGLIIASPAGAEIGDAAVRLGIPTVDCSQARAEDAGVPLVVPWIDAIGDADRGIVSIPDPAATLVASLLAPLARAGVRGPGHATVLVPASREGKAGIEELSRQVVALFNNQTPPRKVFPNGLAFDLLPVVGASVADDGWAPRERAVAVQIARLVGEDDAFDVTLVGVPVFSGISAEVTFVPSRVVPVELALRLLADGGVQVPESGGVRYLPRPRRVEGRSHAHAGRVRIGADGRTLHLWGSMDNLRATAAAAVSSLAGLLGVASGAEPLDVDG
jgi:aspartate-semialdehyde dehydrogenase